MSNISNNNLPRSNRCLDDNYDVKESGADDLEMTPERALSRFAMFTPEQAEDFARNALTANGRQNLRRSSKFEELRANDLANTPALRDMRQLVAPLARTIMVEGLLKKFDAFFKTLGPGCTLETLRPQKRQDLDAEIESFIARTMELRARAFYRKNGCSIETVQGLLPACEKMQFFSEDFNMASFLHGNSAEINIAELVNQNKSEELKVGKTFKEVNRSFNIYEKFKLYLAAAKKLKKGIDDLTEEEFTVIEGKLDEEQMLMATKKADQAYQDLMKKEETHQKSAQVRAQAGKSHKKKNYVTAPTAIAASSKAKVQSKAAIDPMRRTILKLCGPNYLNKYTLDPRVMRWSANDLEVIRGFGDKYQDLSLKERKYQRAAHYLSGIERIISEPELARNYTFETTYREPNGKTRRGLGLYARMVDNGGNSYLGIVRLGIDPNRVIYHAMFEQIGEGTCSLADIKKQSETDSPANGPWENISESSFNLVTNEGVERVISLENGKKEKDRVTFLFYPLV